MTSIERLQLAEGCTIVCIDPPDRVDGLCFICGRDDGPESITFYEDDSGILLACRREGDREDWIAYLEGGEDVNG